MKLVVGWRLPSVAIRATVEVVATGLVMFSMPQPVQALSPTATQTNRSTCKPRRLLQPKQQNASASAEPGKDVRELCKKVATVVVATVNVEEATVPAGVTDGGEKMHEVPAGNPAQLNETAEANPFCGATMTVAALLRPAVTVSDAGVTRTEKAGFGGSRIYAAETTGLVECDAALPVANSPVELSATTAMALRVFVTVTVMGPAYIGELVVGVAPLVV